MRFTSALLLLCVSASNAFTVAPATTAKVRATNCIPKQVGSRRSNDNNLVLYAEGGGVKKRKSGLDSTVRDRLVTESIAPWRTLRLFLYGAAGSSALLGGFITLTGTIAALTGNRPDLDMSTQYQNLAIDFGAVAAFAFLFKYDTDQGAELNESVQAKVERKKEQAQLVKGMRAREAQLKLLSLEIQVSVDGTTKEAIAGDLQLGAKQHMIIVAGPKKACRDALVGANLMKNDFSLSNVLVVPYDTGVGVSTAPAAEGFAERPSYETQPYVARPTGKGWEDYIKAEMADAVTQSGVRAEKEGIAIVVSNTGQVIRRGVGTVPWRQMVDELTGKESEDLPLI
jgi:hypothetical protein